MHEEFQKRKKLIVKKRDINFFKFLERILPSKRTQNKERLGVWYDETPLSLFLNS